MAEERVEVSEKVCPKCGKPYRGHLSISRVDNVTPICPLCGTREALDSLGYGFSDEEKEEIIAQIRQVEDEYFKNRELRRQEQNRIKND